MIRAQLGEDAGDGVCMISGEAGELRVAIAAEKNAHQLTMAKCAQLEAALLAEKAMCGKLQAVVVDAMMKSTTSDAALRAEIMELKRGGAGGGGISPAMLAPERAEGGDLGVAHSRMAADALDGLVRWFHDNPTPSPTDRATRIADTITTVMQGMASYANNVNRTRDRTVKRAISKLCAAYPGTLTSSMQDNLVQTLKDDLLPNFTVRISGYWSAVRTLISLATGMPRIRMNRSVERGRVVPEDELLGELAGLSVRGIKPVAFGGQGPVRARPSQRRRRHTVWRDDTPLDTSGSDESESGRSTSEESDYDESESEFEDAGQGGGKMQSGAWIKYANEQGGKRIIGGKGTASKGGKRRMTPPSDVDSDEEAEEDTMCTVGGVPMHVSSKYVPPRGGIKQPADPAVKARPVMTERQRVLKRAREKRYRAEKRERAAREKPADP